MNYVLFLGMALMAGQGFGQHPARLYNVVLVLTDDLGWYDLGCYGNPYHETPNLDALARESVRFTQAYAAAPVCSPTRASLLTGQYPARLGLTDFIPGRNARTDIVVNDPLLTPPSRQFLPLEAVTLAEVLRAGGYWAGHIGKWHLSENRAYYPDKQGFDTTIAVAPAGGPPGYFYPYKTSWFALTDLQPGGKPGEYLTDRLTTEAVHLLERWRDEPFFLYLAHYAPHIPIQAPAALVEKYEVKRAKLPAGTFANPYYAAMIETIDQSVGRLVETLKQTGQYDHTVFIFMSDNGGLTVPEGPHTPATTSGPLRDGKGFLSEGGLRVPLLIRWPGITPGVSEYLVSTVDFFPTITRLLGQPGGQTDGLDLRPALERPTRSRTEPLFWHYPHYSNQGGKPSGAIRSGQHKLIEDFETGNVALFDVVADPGEQRDLAKAEPKRTAHLLARLRQWRTRVGAPMPTRNPNVPITR